MDDLERRVIHLEHSSTSDRQLTQAHLAMLYQRLQAVEDRPMPSPFPSWLQGISPGSVLRILLALGLPLIVWLATGDLAKALRAAIR